MIEIIVSGGQTGVDRAALDAALSLGIKLEGWCPLGRRAEDGRLAARYPLRETPQPDYQQRTEWNVRDSDGTLLVSSLPLSGGTALTQVYAKKLGRPWIVAEIQHTTIAMDITAWLQKHQIKRLNIAGPRESNVPGIYQLVKTWLTTQLPIWNS